MIREIWVNKFWGPNYFLFDQKKIWTKLTYQPDMILLNSSLNATTKQEQQAEAELGQT